MSLKRTTAASIAADTLIRIEMGQYDRPDGETILLQPAIVDAIAATIQYPPDAVIDVPGWEEVPTRIEITPESTLAAIQRLHAEGERELFVLNFASAKNPGGGFLGGAKAQEESLARSSALYPCIRSSPMYDFHRDQSDLRYSDWAIYSPNVPVFRDDDGGFLDEAIPVTFLTCPAVNAGEVLRREPHARADIEQVMGQRIERVLDIAAHHRHRTLVLGAWGCGVFRNDPDMIARLFHQSLSKRFRGAFSRVVFAIMDTSEKQVSLLPFQRVFGR